MPGMIAALSMLQTLLLTALSVAREREQGTFDQLLVTPLLAHRDHDRQGAAAGADRAGAVHHRAGRHAAVVQGADGRLACSRSMPAWLCFTIASVGIGLSISAVSANMQQAMLYTFVLIMPLMLLSGLTTPVRNMPEALQIADARQPAALRHRPGAARLPRGRGPAHRLAQPHPAGRHRGHHAAAGGLAVPPSSCLNRERDMKNPQRSSSSMFRCAPLLAALMLAAAAPSGRTSRRPRPRRPPICRPGMAARPSCSMRRRAMQQVRPSAGRPSATRCSIALRRRRSPPTTTCRPPRCALPRAACSGSRPRRSAGRSSMPAPASTRQRQSEVGSGTRLIDALNPSNREQLIGALSEPHNLYQAGFDASWELDLWGRVRRAVEAADADVAASQAMLRAGAAGRAGGAGAQLLRAAHGAAAIAHRARRHRRRPRRR